MPKILLFGAGAIGGVYTHILRHTDLTAVCRSNYTAARDNGFTIDSTLYGKVHTKPHVVSAVPDIETYDYIVVTSKSLPGIANTVAPALKGRPTTVIVLIQNGIGIENEFHAAFPENPILSCVVYLPATQISPGVVKMGNLEGLEIGTYPAEASNAPADAFAEVWKAGGGKPVVYDDVQPLRWKKMIINASWNPICALVRCNDTQFLAMAEPYAEELIWGVMKEVVAVGQACGIAVDEDMARHQLERAKARGLPGVEPSMLQDVKAGRRMEVEVLVGNVVRLAEEKGVSVVFLRALYAMIKTLDVSLAQR